MHSRTISRQCELCICEDSQLNHSYERICSQMRDVPQDLVEVKRSVGNASKQQWQTGFENSYFWETRNKVRNKNDIEIINVIETAKYLNRCFGVSLYLTNWHKVGIPIRATIEDNKRKRCLPIKILAFFPLTQTYN